MAIFERFKRKGSATTTTASSETVQDSTSIGNPLATNIPHQIQYSNTSSDATLAWQLETGYRNDEAELYNLVSSKFDEVLTLIDGGSFSGDERDLAILQPPASQLQRPSTQESSREIVTRKLKVSTKTSSSPFTSINYFAKVNLYANSRLPLDLPPMRLYIPTFPLLGLAAQYSEDVYSKPEEKETHIEADRKMGTKTMVIKSVPMDDVNTIVFAIRGTQTFTDLAVNFNTVPVSPVAFLVRLLWGM